MLPKGSMKGSPLVQSSNGVSTSKIDSASNGDNAPVKVSPGVPHADPRNSDGEQVCPS